MQARPLSQSPRVPPTSLGHLYPDENTDIRSFLAAHLRKGNKQCKLLQLGWRSPWDERRGARDERGAFAYFTIQPAGCSAVRVGRLWESSN